MQGKSELIGNIVVLEGDVECLRERCAIKDAEIERLTAYQNETALAWTKLTESQEEKIAKLKALVRELADDLESEVEGRYQSVKDHPAMTPKYERDMEPVRRARLIEQITKGE